jgi:hypothetical protein
VVPAQQLTRRKAQAFLEFLMAKAHHRTPLLNPAEYVGPTVDIALLSPTKGVRWLGHDVRVTRDHADTPAKNASHRGAAP